MWRKPEDAKPAAPAAEVPPTTPAPAAPAQRVEPVIRSVAGLTAEVVQPSGGIITSTILIKGEVHGTDDLYIDGEVQGTIHLSNGRVTVGPHAKIAADVDAREIVVRGKVNGALRGRDRVEIGSTGEVRGDIATMRIAIGEGAQMHSKVEIIRADSAKTEQPAAKSSSKGSGSGSGSGSNSASNSSTNSGANSGTPAAVAQQAVAMKASGENGI